MNRIDPEYPGLHFPRLATQCTDLVLVEDIPSAERLSEYLPTAALLGARLTHDQAEYLASNGVKSLVFCLDDDATHRGVQQAREHGLYFRTSSVHCSPDPKDMTAQELNDLVQRIHRTTELWGAQRPATAPG